jgi:L-aspartate oxidase
VASSLAAQSTDVIIVGSGLAGLTAALRLAEAGASVTVATKDLLETSNSTQAQGGLAAVSASDDSFAEHCRDTRRAGAGLCDERAVEQIIAAGPQIVRNLLQHGVGFDRSAAGDLDLGREGGHSKRRVVHRGDRTGAAITAPLCEQLRQHPRVTVLERHTAVDLVTTRTLGHLGVNRCLGVYLLGPDSGVTTVAAGATVIASGGLGQIYLHSTNPDVATGDGIAMAYRAGCQIANMEFIQFHPTTLYDPGGTKPHLISEAVRGEGVRLLTAGGEDLMAGQHPLGSLAPRDIVARSIDSHLKRSGDRFVLLDTPSLPKPLLEHRFPNMLAACAALGLEPWRQPIPVVPAAHYCCGGIRVALDGQTQIADLFAIGEAAHTGLHGANRLASNSLLEAAVLATAVVDPILASLANERPSTLKPPPWDVGAAQSEDERVVLAHGRDELRRTMWNYVGIERSDARLGRARARLHLLRAELNDYYWRFELSRELVELRNMVTVARLVVRAARTRRESRGLHYNIDVPELDDANWLEDTILEPLVRS